MMPHVDPDRLAQLALGEPTEPDLDGAGVSAHLDTCADCRTELDGLHDTVTRVRYSTIRPADLAPPPERVWRAISADLAQPHGGAPTGMTHPPSGVAVLRPAPPTRGPRWVLAAVAVFAALAGIGGTLAAMNVLDDEDHRSRPDHEITLAPLAGGPQNITGAASVTVDGGSTELAISTSGLDDSEPGFYEVWVINPDDLTRMYSIGALTTDASGRFTVPPNVDLGRYSVVDISIEPDDGDPAHSTHSVLRGSLPTS
jgi:hypothetical protein